MTMAVNKLNSEGASDAQDHYAEHLADINKEVDVVATGDIVNAKGVLIARKGARIDHSTAKRLVQHKLARPLEQQVQLSDSIDPNALYAAWTEMVKSFPDVSQVQAALKFEREYQTAMTELKIHPLVIQKLTVMSRQMPEVYKKSLFCAWLSALLVKELGMDGGAVSAAIMASLTRDMGFLHLDPQVINKEGELTPEEWRAIQAHVVIGQIFLADLPDMDQRVPVAVLEHHERFDGTGYPLGKSGKALNLFSNVIGLADSLQGMRINQFAKKGRTLLDAIPYLHMNDFTHSVEVCRAMVTLLKRTGLQPSRTNPYQNAGQWSQRLQQRCGILKDARQSLVALQRLLLDGGIGKDRGGATLITIVNNTIVKMTSSGFDGDQLLSWLSSCNDDSEETLTDLYQTDLISGELMWHLNHVHRSVETYCEQCDPNQPSYRAAKEIMQQVGGYVGSLRNE